MTKYIGSYNIDNEGEVWNGYTRYTMVIFSRFDENEKKLNGNVYISAAMFPTLRPRNRSRNF